MVRSLYRHPASSTTAAKIVANFEFYPAPTARELSA